MDVVNVIAILVAGSMVGCELCIAAFVHPTLDRLPDVAHQPVASALARLLGKVMPPWYILFFLLSVAQAFIAMHHSGRFPIWFVASAVLVALASLFSVLCLVPINNRIASWEKTAPPADWKTYRARWDMLDRWRLLILAIAFVCVVVGVVGR